MGFTEILTIVFVVLKLMGIIDWSWVLVLLPEIIAVAIYVVLVIASVHAHNKAMKHFDDMWDRF